MVIVETLEIQVFWRRYFKLLLEVIYANYL